MILRTIFIVGNTLLSIGSTIALAKKLTYYSKQIHRYTKAFRYTKK